MTTLQNIRGIQLDWTSRTGRLWQLVLDTKSAPNLLERRAIRNASQDVHEIVLQVTEIFATYQNDIQSKNSEMIRAAALSTIDTLCFSLGALGLISSQDQETKHRYPWLEGVSIGALALSQIASKVNDYFHLKGMREEREALQNLKTLEAILTDPMTEKIWQLFGVAENEESIKQSLTEDDWKERRDAFLREETSTLRFEEDERRPLLTS